MNIVPITNSNTDFKASMKLTPHARHTIDKMDANNIQKFIEYQKHLRALKDKSLLLLSRKKFKDGSIIPVITNLNTGAMVSIISNNVKVYHELVIDLLKIITKFDSDQHRRLFSNDKSVVKNSINDTLKKTYELRNNPPKPYQNLKKIVFSKENQDTMLQYEAIFNDEKIKLPIGNNKYLNIQNYDEGYHYFLTDSDNKKTGEYFIVAYTNKGFRLYYDPSKINKNEVLSLFKKYTQKAIEMRF